MTEVKKEYQVELLTPCFCKIGVNEPEIRGASIRGMIREWKRLLENNSKAPDVIWGGAGGNASKVGVDVKNIKTTQSKHGLLPHKNGTMFEGLDSGGTFTLILNRLVGCSDAKWKEAQQDVENWLVLGCLGQRANRAAGSVWCEDLGIDTETRLRDYIQGLSGSFSLAGPFKSALDARETASNTTKNARLFGSFNPREPSPIKMKIVRLRESDYHILFFAQDSNLINDAEKELKSKQDNHRWIDVEFTSIEI